MAVQRSRHSPHRTVPDHVGGTTIHRTCQDHDLCRRLFYVIFLVYIYHLRGGWVRHRVHRSGRARAFAHTFLLLAALRKCALEIPRCVRVSLSSFVWNGIVFIRPLNTVFFLFVIRSFSVFPCFFFLRCFFFCVAFLNFYLYICFLFLYQYFFGVALFFGGSASFIFDVSDVFVKSHFFISEFFVHRELWILCLCWLYECM